MTPRRLAVKLFATDAVPRDELHRFIGIFHRFIQEAAVPGLLIDVADYAHVPDGPGVMLIGKDVDYGIDLAGGRTGLLTVRKHTGDAPLEALFRDTLSWSRAAAHALEADESAAIQFVPGELEVTFPDRLAAPNTAAAFELASKELLPAARAELGAVVRLANAAADDPRRMLTIALTQVSRSEPKASEGQEEGR
jgi:hypothetical protein